MTETVKLDKCPRCRDRYIGVFIDVATDRYTVECRTCSYLKSGLTRFELKGLQDEENKKPRNPKRGNKHEKI